MFYFLGQVVSRYSHLFLFIASVVISKYHGTQTRFKEEN